MEYPKPIATSNEGWVIEIIEAYRDAKEAIPFAEKAGKMLLESDLFHLAPVVCLKFRDLMGSDEYQAKAKDAAIGSYIANQEAGNRNLNDPLMAFAFCYIIAHYGLGLLGEDQCQEILQFVEMNLAKIKTAVAS